MLGRVIDVRVAVVGGGISGLAAAWFLRQSLGPDAEIVVLEKQPVVGGHLRVSDVAGLPVDEGAESLLARRPEAVDLAVAVGLGDDVVHPASVGAGLWSRGAIVPLPAGTVMGVPADPAQLAGVLTVAEMTAAIARDASYPQLRVEEDVAIGRLVRSRYGDAVADRLVEPLLGGVYAGRADELSLDATVPALGAAVRTARTLGEAVAAASPGAAAGAGPVFAGLTGGVGRLPGAVAAASGADVRTGVTVRSVERTADGWRLVIGPVPEPSVLDVDAVVVATPAVAAARLLADAAPAAAAELGGVEAASMAIVTLALPADGFPAAPSSTGFLVPPVDGRTIKAVTFSSVKWPWLGGRAGGLVLLRASLGRHGEASDLQRDDDELVAAALADVRAATGYAGAVADSRVTRWGGALPQYAVGHLDRVARVRAAVDALPGLAVCGAVYDGVGLAACVGAAHDAASGVAAYLSDRRARIET
ncbi:protoporphyrinogen oxidase [Jiangella alkaliphila]|uniref:Coproporphyrinogen III oxidase n=1 Tax=Jiangella alkaliphila TaxID=419479 RepID=A0A1H2KZK9_9ACTN|nr:protoporphyrinogen oxidase [Jiangella alkaliphila]SDU74129.1 oxygen-dependent protoporphyrinogen oxidase [Jiangella alkaliphila]